MKQSESQTPGSHSADPERVLEDLVRRGVIKRVLPDPWSLSDFVLYFPVRRPQEDNTDWQ